MGRGIPTPPLPFLRRGEISDKFNGVVNMRFPIGDDLFRMGLLVMGSVLLLFLIALLVLRLFGGRLKRTLEQEYGKKRH